VGLCKVTIFQTIESGRDSNFLLDLKVTYIMQIVPLKKKSQ
jgi:hypothetical protein